MTYCNRQREVYLTSLKNKRYRTAWDAIWRASSERDLLLPHELSDIEITESRVYHLLDCLGWPHKLDQ